MDGRAIYSDLGISKKSLFCVLVCDRNSNQSLWSMSKILWTVFSSLVKCEIAFIVSKWWPDMNNDMSWTKRIIFLKLSHQTKAILQNCLTNSHAVFCKLFQIVLIGVTTSIPKTTFKFYLYLFNHCWKCNNVLMHLMSVQYKPCT